MTSTPEGCLGAKLTGRIALECEADNEASEIGWTMYSGRARGCEIDVPKSRAIHTGYGTEPHFGYSRTASVPLTIPF